jgi:hypothetical protein
LAELFVHQALSRGHTAMDRFSDVPPDVWATSRWSPLQRAVTPPAARFRPRNDSRYLTAACLQYFYSLSSLEALYLFRFCPHFLCLDLE